jgi:heme A synthase
MDAGMACPDVPLCLGRVVPPMIHPLVALHYTHRVLALVTAVVVITGAAAVVRTGARGAPARLALATVVLVLAQIGLGVWSVAGRLAVAPVSLHSLVAALLFGASVALARWGRLPTLRAARATALGVARA